MDPPDGEFHQRLHRWAVESGRGETGIAQHVYEDNVSFAVNIRVTDDDGEALTSTTVTVINEPPELTLDANGIIAFAGGDAYLALQGVEQSYTANARTPAAMT